MKLVILVTITLVKTLVDKVLVTISVITGFVPKWTKTTKGTWPSRP